MSSVCNPTLVAAGVLLALAAGCVIESKDGRAEARFYDRRPRPADSTPVMQGPEALAPGARPREPLASDITDAELAISAEVMQTVGQASRPAPATTQAAATQPMESGVYQVVGAVVAVVDGRPIYAEDALRPLEPLLVAQARELEAAKFIGVARDALRKQVEELVRSELEVTAARSQLDDREVQMAEMLTEQWRMRQYSIAGGSRELAIRKAASEGFDFEELVQQEFRLNLTRLYYQRKVFPRVQVTVDDARAYYAQNVRREFTEFGQARFRLIKIEPAKLGGTKETREKIEEITRRVAAGESFAEIAGQFNHDALFLRHKGDPSNGEPVNQGAFSIEAVERAVWASPVGQMTEPVEHRGNVYLVFVESRKDGRVRDFREVQEQILTKLRGQQLQDLRQEQRKQLAANAVVVRTPDMLEAAVQMAMQRYPQWRSGK